MTAFLWTIIALNGLSAGSNLAALARTTPCDRKVRRAIALAIALGNVAWAVVLLD